MLLMGKLTISMAMFNSYFDITRGYHRIDPHPAMVHRSTCSWSSTRLLAEIRPRWTSVNVVNGTWKAAPGRYFNGIFYKNVPNWMGCIHWNWVFYHFWRWLKVVRGIFFRRYNLAVEVYQWWYVIKGYSYSNQSIIKNVHHWDFEEF